MNEHLSLNTRIVLVPRRAALAAGGDATVELLLRVQAPAAPAGHAASRPPQALALVLDRSGSMAGRPLAEARRCAEFVVGALRPTDSVALVAFDHRVTRLADAQPVGDGRALREAIAGLREGGNTDLHGGWLDGAHALAEQADRAAVAEPAALRRVILLSDGQANAGLTDPPAIAHDAQVWRQRGVATSTFGLGRHFNEDLMLAMARAGGGNAHYGDCAEDLMQPFRDELDLLANLCLKDLRVELELADGVRAELLNDLPVADAAGRAAWRLPDLAWDAEAWALLRLHVDACALAPAGRSLELLRVAVRAAAATGEAVEPERARLSLPVVSAAAWAAMSDDEAVSRRLLEVAAGHAMLELRGAIARGDWPAAERLLAEAEQRFAGQAWLVSMLAAMRELARAREREVSMKEARYASARLMSRVASVHESFDDLDDDAAAAVPKFLRRKVRQGKDDG